MAIELALCSPSFLYLAEPSDTPQASRRLNSYELASRLSYFLWGSMPDDTLFELAAKGQLTDTKTLAGQTLRLLDDPKSQYFLQNFTGQWLELHKIKEVAVEPRLHPQYSDYLKHLMVKETEQFFEEILRNDLSALNFLDSDFMMLNDRLAFHYGIDGVQGQHFRRVPVPETGHRGGLLGHAGILTLTTCGTRTSPVMRGVWILENLLGTHPPPPPKDVPALAPDTRNTKTIREQLAKHREDASCARCHNKIDPLGLAMENYNVTGQWRDHYYHGYNRRSLRKGAPVNARTQLPTGEEITTPADLRTALLHHKEPFTHSLVENLFTYALGRAPTYPDRPPSKPSTKTSPLTAINSGISSSPSLNASHSWPSEQTRGLSFQA